ncbi:hypothetical protein RRG08_023974 [Elysia crispata]|uniref:Uncharacterized protein n=1 Tax=Elysia crispata TaxID=231223 RepID=A0AAE1D168_9GAST|nr:hypothetical protein RRG08_023974 [Elysia crispata]
MLGTETANHAAGRDGPKEKCGNNYFLMSLTPLFFSRGECFTQRRSQGFDGHGVTRVNHLPIIPEAVLDELSNTKAYFFLQILSQLK